ncbi:MAG TPA: RNA-directed DNA polymerase [Clostridia bacterium]|nr:RNA-directed DNA polymerase [Clostridia bacterium]
MYRELMNRKLYHSIIDGLEPEKSVSYDTYVDLLIKLEQGSHIWPVPRRIEICKTFSQKRRIVYAYPNEEMFILRAVNHYLCSSYQKALAYSYFPSRKRTPSQCLSYILQRKEDYLKANPQVDDLYGMHMDISDYFNSMDPNLLFERLPEDLKTDQDFVSLFTATLLNPWCESGGERIQIDKKGAMAGLPFTAFFAAIYLNGMDKCFEKAGIPYARYSDDILFFAETEETVREWAAFVKSYLLESRLNMNDDKTQNILPNKPWTFIGFEMDQRQIDISIHQYEKLKRRISKWARRYRKRVEEGYGKDKRRMTPEKAVMSLIKNINRALFKPIRDKYCWAQWAFPTINVIQRIKALDVLIQERLRFVFTGGYSKKNYKKLPYERLKEMGYHSLEKLYVLYRYRPESFQVFLDYFILQPNVKGSLLCEKQTPEQCQ